LTFVFKHPNYYKELATNCRRDNKPHRKEEDEVSSDKHQASSTKRQAPEQDGHEDS